MKTESLPGAFKFNSKIQINFILDLLTRDIATKQRYRKQDVESDN